MLIQTSDFGYCNSRTVKTQLYWMNNFYRQHTSSLTIHWKTAKIKKKHKLFSRVFTEKCQLLSLSRNYPPFAKWNTMNLATHVAVTYSSKFLNTSGSTSLTLIHCFSASGPKHIASNTGLLDARINLWALNIYKININTHYELQWNVTFQNYAFDVICYLN